MVLYSPICPNNGSPPKANTVAACAPAAQNASGMLLIKSAFVTCGTSCLTGICNPNNLAGFSFIAHVIMAYTRHIPSCIVATVMVKPEVLPPTAVRAAVLYSLYFIFPAYQNTKKRRRATESGACHAANVDPMFTYLLLRLFCSAGVTLRHGDSDLW